MKPHCTSHEGARRGHKTNEGSIKKDNFLFNCKSSLISWKQKQWTKTLSAFHIGPLFLQRQGVIGSEIRRAIWRASNLLLKKVSNV